MSGSGFGLRPRSSLRSCLESGVGVVVGAQAHVPDHISIQVLGVVIRSPIRFRYPIKVRSNLRVEVGSRLGLDPGFGLVSI